MIKKTIQPSSGKQSTEKNTEMTVSRLAALRLTSIDTLTVKEPSLPVAYRLNITEPLSNAQLNRLVLATPWKPMMIEATVGEWNDDTKSFDASIEVIESQPKIPTPKLKKNTLKWGHVKRKRGFVAYD